MKSLLHLAISLLLLGGFVSGPGFGAGIPSEPGTGDGKSGWISLENVQQLPAGQADTERFDDARFGMFFKPAGKSPDEQYSLPEEGRYASAGNEGAGGFEVSDSDSLEGNFILRIEDLFMDSSWNYLSMDRMSFKIATRLYGFEGPQPRYTIDGIPFDPTVFGTTFSQLIPAAKSQIERIEMEEEYGVSQGIRYHSGLFQIRTIKPEPGLSIFASGQTGHNIGEPGPWAFDPERATPNIERFGPWGDAGLSYVADDWYIKGLVRSHGYKRMNVHVKNRMKNTRLIPETGERLRADAITTLGMAEAGYSSGRLDTRMQAVRTRGKDYFFLHPFGREVTSFLNTSQYSTDLKYHHDDRWTFRTLYQYREKTFEDRRNHFGHRIGLSERNHSILATAEYESINYSIAGGWEKKWGRFTDPENSRLLHRVRRDKLHFEQYISLSPIFAFKTFQSVFVEEGEHAYTMKGALHYQPGQRWSGSFGGGYIELLPAVEAPLNDLIQHGYTILDQLSVPEASPVIIGNGRLATFSLANQVQLTPRLLIEVDLSFVKHFSLSIPFQQVEYDPDFNTMPGPYTLFNAQEGNRINADVSIHHEPSSLFHHTVKARYGETIGGGSIYRDYWETVPNLITRYTASFHPYPDLELMVNIQYRSETKWREFENLDGETNRNFYDAYPVQTYTLSNRTPQHLNVDFRMAKWFWNQRLRGLLLLKNIFDNELQYHPIGVRERFGFMARVELRL